MKLERRGGKANVYLVRCEQYLKIGVAGYLVGRMVSLQTGNPFELDLIAYRPFDTAKIADAAEAHLHSTFEAQRHRGEWFKISDEEAIEALRALSVADLEKPATVTIHWQPFKGNPGYSEEVPAEWVQ